MNTKKNTKKGFTIVELVIVIAVIGVLAAILIPTFSNIIRKAEISTDVQTCRNLNTVLRTAQAESRIPQSVWDVLYLENESGYSLANLNPTADNMYYAWDEEENQFLYIEADLESVYYPDDTVLIPTNCWITVSTAEEAAKVAAKGFNIALENDITEDITLDNVVSVDTLGYNCGTLTMNGGSYEAETVKLVGSFTGITTINNSSANVVTSGSMATLSASNVNSVSIGGSVSSYSASSNVTSSVTSAGTIKTVNSANQSVISNSGVIKANESSTAHVGENVTTREISNKEDLESVRYQVACGQMNFKGETIALDQDINMNGIAFTPISSYYRKSNEDSSAAGSTYGNDAWFQGTFDGAGYKITNLSNNGFTVSGLTAESNSTSVYVNGVKFKEAIYGLFASVKDATIKNITLTVDIDMTMDVSRSWVGDCVGGLVGFATGTCSFENITVNGTIKGYDDVGGIVGRCQNGTFTFKNCVNNANVTSVRKAGGIVGFCTANSGSTCTINIQKDSNGNGVVNNGIIKCTGHQSDDDLGVRNQANDAVLDGHDGTGYYVAGLFATARSGITFNGINDNFSCGTLADVIIAGTSYKGDSGYITKINS